MNKTIHHLLGNGDVQCGATIYSFKRASVDDARVTCDVCKTIMAVKVSTALTPPETWLRKPGESDDAFRARIAEAALHVTTKVTKTA